MPASLLHTLWAGKMPALPMNPTHANNGHQPSGVPRRTLPLPHHKHRTGAIDLEPDLATALVLHHGCNVPALVKPANRDVS